jgi:regulator of nucleoside diphosphate kinase
MHQNTSGRPMPAIIVSDADQERLVGVAMAAIDRIPGVAEDLLAEMDRATVVAADALPSNVVRMGSTVTYGTADGRTRRVTLVFGGEADIARDRISILTPVGTALIGLAVGQSITWTTRDGREQELSVLSVENTGR